MWYSLYASKLFNWALWGICYDPGFPHITMYKVHAPKPEFPILQYIRYISLIMYSLTLQCTVVHLFNPGFSHITMYKVHFPQPGFPHITHMLTTFFRYKQRKSMVRQMLWLCKAGSEMLRTKVLEHVLLLPDIART